jgi:hypothetical protein
MNAVSEQDSSHQLGVLFAALVVEVIIGVISNILAAGLQTYLPISNLDLIIFLAVSIPILIVVRVGFEYIAKQSIGLEKSRKRAMLAWGQLVYWLGAMTTVGIVGYLVWSGVYPKSIDVSSVSCWGLSCAWVFSLAPWGWAMIYRARIKVLANWSMWLRKIGQMLNTQDRLTESDVALLMGASELEAQEAMKLFAEQTDAILEKDYGDKLVLKRIR